MIAADIPAVLALDQRTLGGLWTKSGYERELESEHSDVLVLLKADSADLLNRRSELNYSEPDRSEPGHSELGHSKLNHPEANGRGKKKGAIELLGVGCLWAILEEAHITTLAVEPSYQGQGLGLLLLTHLLERAYDRGLTRATLEVRLSNQRALSLYQKFDFKEAGQRKRYYADGENARILWRSGLQTEDCLAQIRDYQARSIRRLGEAQGYHFYRDRHPTEV